MVSQEAGNCTDGFGVGRHLPEKAGDCMKVGFIGAGKVGFSLGKFFAEGGVPVTGFYSRHGESAQEAAAFCEGEAFGTLETIVQASDVLFLTVPDGSIASVFQQMKQFGLREKQICHCSGAMTAREAFPGLAETGAYGYSIHPLFPISSKTESYRELAGAFFCLEGTGPHLDDWQTLLESLGAKAQRIEGEAKPRYHAACAIASNLMCALAQESIELLSSCGFSEAQAREALAPLMRSNLEHIIQDGTAGALTGPLERADAGTVAKHLDQMPTEREREMYALLSWKLLAVAKEKHPERDYGAIEDLCEKELV